MYVVVTVGDIFGLIAVATVVVVTFSLWLYGLYVEYWERR